jgi:hypothetical protein
LAAFSLRIRNLCANLRSQRTSRNQARRAGLLWKPTGHHVLHPLSDIYRVIANALVVPADEGELYRRLETNVVSCV